MSIGWRAAGAVIGLVIGAVAATGFAKGVALAQEPTASRESATAAARIAALDLAAAPLVSTEDYAIAAAVLEVAHAIAPTDEEILRRLLEAHAAAGNHGRTLELGPSLLAVAPQDTVAQLRLITGRVLALQDVDQRLRVYDGFLGPRGAGLDPSIRSRLALDAALLLRERGDEQGFADRLATALELDLTNKDAAALAVAYYSDRVADQAGRMELLVTLFRADPLDPETHLAIGRELSAAGAYGAAGRSYAMARALRDTQMAGMTAEEQAELQVVVWQLEGAEALVTGARNAIDQQRQSLEARRRQALAAGAVESELPRITDVQMPLPIAKVVLVAAAATGDDDAVDWAMSELELTARTIVEPRAGGPEGEPPQIDQAAMQRIFGDMLWMRLWAGRELDLAGEQLAALRQAEGINPAAMSRLEGWYLIRRGEIDGAEERLRPLADEDPLALLGLAVAAEADGDADGAKAWYADLYLREAGSVVAAYAKSRIVALEGDPPAPTEHAGRMASMAQAGVPRWAEAMIQNPRSFMSIAIEPDPIEVNGTTRVAVRLRLRNTAPIPLAVGPSAPICSRLLLTPMVEYGLNRAAGMQTMEVVSMDRRLRLMPQESMEVVVRPELGSLWYVLNQLGDRAVRLRWRALQSFVLTRDGIFTEGPLALSAESAVQTRQPLEMAMAELPALLGTIASGGPVQLHAALASLGWRWGATAERSGLSGPDVEAIGAALADRYARSSRAERIMILSMLPPGTRLPALAPVDAAAREDADPAAQVLLLITRVTEADDPILTAAANSGDAALASFATLVRQRLASGVQTFARPAPADGAGGAGGGGGGQGR